MAFWKKSKEEQSAPNSPVSIKGWNEKLFNSISKASSLEVGILSIEHTLSTSTHTDRDGKKAKYKEEEVRFDECLLLAHWSPLPVSASINFLDTDRGEIVDSVGTSINPEKHVGFFSLSSNNVRCASLFEELLMSMGQLEKGNVRRGIEFPHLDFFIFHEFNYIESELINTFKTFKSMNDYPRLKFLIRDPVIVQWADLKNLDSWSSVRFPIQDLVFWKNISSVAEFIDENPWVKR